eukprot:1339184-Pleurochrysis_carterae.AAC.3
MPTSCAAARSSVVAQRGREHRAAQHRAHLFPRLEHLLTISNPRLHACQHCDHASSSVFARGARLLRKRAPALERAAHGTPAQRSSRLEQQPHPLRKQRFSL